MLALARAAILLVIGWSAFAFGAVYPWAYGPALAGCAVACAIAWLSRRGHLSREEWWFAGALAVTAVAIVVQIIPMPAWLLHSLSPQADEALRQLDVQYALGITVDPAGVTHGLSLWSPDTRLALLFFAGLVALWAAASRIMSAEGALPTIRGIAAIAAALAVTGVVQEAVTDIPYGFWQSQQGGHPFGPFINRNHYAGWMLLAVPTIIGGLCATVARKSFWVAATWRERFLWLGSPRAGEALLFATAATVSAVALVLTYSKSAVAGACWIFLALALVALGRGGSVALRVLFSTASVVALAALLAWAGLDTIGRRFDAMTTTGLAGRVDAWRDAVDVARRFPVTGAGINTYSRAMLLYQQRDLAHHYSAAHNDYLQIAAEGGVLVGLPAVVAGIVFVRTAWRRLAAARQRGGEWWYRVGALVGMTALGLQEAVDFGLQIPAIAALFAVLAAIATHDTSRLRAPAPRH